MGRLLGYQRLTGAEMLRRAARYPDFQTLGVEACDELAALSAPESLPEALRQEVQQGLLHLGGTACGGWRNIGTVGLIV